MQIINLPYISNSALIFAKIAHLPWAVYLDSCHPHATQGQYDIFSAWPYITLCTEGALTKISTAADIQLSNKNPFSLVQEYLAKHISSHPTLPFIGGALGYFSYDLARRLENLPTLAQADIALPEMAIGIYDWAIIVDHSTQTMSLISPHKDPNTQTLLPQILDMLHTEAPITESLHIEGTFQSNLSKEAYTQAFHRVQQYIRDGDCYQVNLSQRFSAKYHESPWMAYQTLREHSAVPYAAYLNHPHATILSLSPERFLKVQDTWVETKPIKGTRPRSKIFEQDLLLAQELMNSPKDRAENLMIVDLLRNDLGKNCRFGSISVPKFCELESFPTVHHLVSTIIGQLRNDRDAIDLLRDCFPGGSITGAPKLRSMEIIEELEPHRRALYCGSIGYISFDGNMDTNIAIRTLVCKDQHIYCSAGGALIADSQVEDEYQETLTKVRKLLHLLENPHA